MTGGWKTSTRRKRLPSDWPAIRLAVLTRDGFICHVCGLVNATEVDHLVAGDNHDPRNLAAICTRDHREKSAREGSAAAAIARQSRPGRRRPREPHPGFNLPR